MEKMTMEAVTDTKRGRPKVEMTWPSENFTFKNLLDNTKEHGLCASSLRNKIRESVNTGEISKVQSLAGKTGRPQNVYSKKCLEVRSVAPDMGVAGFTTNECNAQDQQDSAGENTPLN